MKQIGTQINLRGLGFTFTTHSFELMMMDLVAMSLMRDWGLVLREDVARGRWSFG
jgi:hypothetical protein